MRLFSCELAALCMLTWSNKRSDKPRAQRKSIQASLVDLSLSSQSMVEIRHSRACGAFRILFFFVLQLSPTILKELLFSRKLVLGDQPEAEEAADVPRKKLTEHHLHIH